MPSFPSFFVSADWSRDPRKRSVHVADLDRRRIQHVERPDWDLGHLLELARRLASGGPVLVGVDLVLGVPWGYWMRVLEEPRWSGVRCFVDWLKTLGRSPEFFDAVEDTASWRVDRPFFRVPAGTGALLAYEARAAGCLRRRIEHRTGAKPLFAVSGFSGTVGSATRDAWKELIPALAGDCDFALWPFEGGLELSFAAQDIVLVESYPGLAYAAALAEELPTHRFLLAKKKAPVRQWVCERVRQAPWVRQTGVDLGALACCRSSEDAFDSFLTAAAVLRCVAEGRALWDTARVDPQAEGAILLAGPVDCERPARRLRVPESEQWPHHRQQPGAGASTHRCPIEGCSKIFRGGRGGWDAHVGSPGMHPEWHPEVQEPSERTELFRQKYSHWFR